MERGGYVVQTLSEDDISGQKSACLHGYASRKLYNINQVLGRANFVLEFFKLTVPLIQERASLEMDSLNLCCSGSEFIEAS